MAGYDGGTFRITWRWKEEVIYAEDAGEFRFDGAWGVSPPVVYVPSASLWDVVVPSWLRGRRAEVVARLAEHSGHVLADTDAGY